MCGICGVAALRGMLNPAIASALPAMADAIRHRGPDGEGFFSDAYTAMGHRRLAIIDRASGAQPMANEDGSVRIVFNGEIYNHRALRRTLVARGHTFRTTSDTEAIVHAYEEYGVGCVERLEGMFAFAVYDQRRREVLLARDRLGKKPLFYAVFDGVLHFASEIKSLRESPVWDDDLNLSNLETYFALGYSLAPDTIYRHVHALEPGHFLHVRNGRTAVTQYWDVQDFDGDRRQGREIVGAVDTALRQAVCDRLESEVPLGAFLSGGIDSGLVVSYMADAADGPVVTTSVGFGDRRRTELPAAALTARRYGTRHVEEVIEPRLEDVLDSVVDAFDEPFADSSAIPTYYVSAAARRHVTVALSGDGGDETFGGYSFRYVPHAIEQAIRSLLPAPGRAAAGWAGRRWPAGRRVPRALRWRTNLQNLAVDGADAYFSDLCFLKPAEVRRLLGAPALDDLRESGAYDRVTAPYRRCGSPDPVQRAQYADLKIYLPNDVLVKVDRMSMAHSLEVRCPLLDHRLIELAFRVPRSVKLPRLRSKALLRALAADRLPRELVTMPKRGFNAPTAEWISGSYRPLFDDDIFGSGSRLSSVADTRRLRQMFDEHCRGEADHSYALWAAWMFERWAQRQDRHPATTRTGARPWPSVTEPIGQELVS